MSATVFDDRACELGEGALWHPERQQFFWFDILGRRLLSRDGMGALEWRFDRMVSAAGWVDRDRLMVATETGLALLDLTTGKLADLIAVEADQHATRSNDGRADRQGGFWFGTMGKSAQDGAGAIYRFYRGKLRKLFDAVSIPNSICFSPDGRWAHFGDTARGLVWRQPLDAEGWPDGERQVFLDVSAWDSGADGAVMDAEGGFCCAFWGQGAVLRFDTAGQQTHRFEVGGRHCSCPAFGDRGQMLVTTALENIADPDAGQGLTYLVRHDLPSLPEPRVLL